MKGTFKRINRNKGALLPVLQASLILLVALNQNSWPSNCIPLGFESTVVSQGPGNRTVIECPESWQVAFPGDTLYFRLFVTNLSPEFDSFLIYIDNPPLPENWTASFYAGDKKVKAIGIYPSQRFELLLEVNVPRDAEPDDYRFRVNLDGAYQNTTQGITVTVESAQRKIGLVCPFPNQNILTGQNASYPIEVTNDGEIAERIFLEANITTEMMIWEISFSQSQLIIDAKSGQWITFTIRPPDIVKEGDYHLNVIASTEDGKVKVTLPLTIRISAIYLLEITGIEPINPQVSTGEKVEIFVAVRNMGQSLLTEIELHVNSVIPNILVTPWKVLALEPEESIKFCVRISPNIDMTQGDYSVEIQAVSDETQSSVRTFPVSVVSAIPWFWITICVTVIATALAVIAIMKVISKYGIKVKKR